MRPIEIPLTGFPAFSFPFVSDCEDTTDRSRITACSETLLQTASPSQALVFGPVFSFILRVFERVCIDSFLRLHETSEDFAALLISPKALSQPQPTKHSVSMPLHSPAF